MQLQQVAMVVMWLESTPILRQSLPLAGTVSFDSVTARHTNDPPELWLPELTSINALLLLAALHFCDLLGCSLLCSS